jgi:hypothetical protein
MDGKEINPGLLLIIKTEMFLFLCTLGFCIYGGFILMYPFNIISVCLSVMTLLYSCFIYLVNILDISEGAKKNKRKIIRKFIGKLRKTLDKYDSICSFILLFFYILIWVLSIIICIIIPSNIIVNILGVVLIVRFLILVFLFYIVLFG